MAADTLKDTLFSAQRIGHIATELAAVHAPVQRKRFIAHATRGLAELSLMQRLRRVTESLHGELPQRFDRALPILRALAPRLNNGFVTLILSDYVALYGTEPRDFELAMGGLEYFTTFGSAEFAVRHFLIRDPARVLRVMERWSRSADAHVRRLASEGSRPRLPWSFRIEPIVQDPELTAGILDQLKADDSLYVRKSVANHLNDVTKLHPGWVLDRLERWPRDDARTRWIVKHALRSLIKRGDRRALALIGATAKPALELVAFRVRPARLTLGDKLRLSCQVVSSADASQRLVIDYAIHYVKSSGAAAAKVFKLKTLTLPARATVAVAHEQVVRDFTTRRHYPGRHEVELWVNGVVMGRAAFVLKVPT